MIYLWSHVAILSAQNPSDSIPVAPAVPIPRALPFEPAPEKGFDGKSEDPMQPISVSIVSPKIQEIVPTSEVDIFFQVNNYTLAPYGNRLHVILDNQAPVEVNQLKRPLTLKDLPPGGHTIRVFAVKPDGRMVPDIQSFSMVYFYVMKKDFQNYINPNTPFLTLNLPLNGNVDSVVDGLVWLDYRIHGTSDQTKGMKVKYRLSNIQGVDESGKGVFWQNLKVGRYDVVTELLDSDNKVVSGLFNRIQRIFEVRPVQKAISTTPSDEATQPHE